MIGMALGLGFLGTVLVAVVMRQLFRYETALYQISHSAHLDATQLRKIAYMATHPWVKEEDV